MTHYDRLGAARDADFQTLKKAFYRQAKICHPDLHHNSSEKTEEFKLLVAAFDVLSDPDKRRVYDEALANQEAFSEASAAQRRETEEMASGLVVQSIMDSDADDTLEELIVGNSLPENATLATLFLDLERTLVFMTFREAKNLYAQRRLRSSLELFRKSVAMSPDNILYRTYLARNLASLGDFPGAKTHYKAALAIGARRIPEQHLFLVRRELDLVAKKQSPFWHRLLNLFADKRNDTYLPPDEEMTEQTSRAIDRMAKKSLHKRLK